MSNNNKTQYELIVFLSEEKQDLQQTFQLEYGENVIGKDPIRASIILNYPEIIKDRHAKITIEDDEGDLDLGLESLSSEDNLGIWRKNKDGFYKLKTSKIFELTPGQEFYLSKKLKCVFQERTNDKQSQKISQEQQEKERRKQFLEQQKLLQQKQQKNKLSKQKTESQKSQQLDQNEIEDINENGDQSNQFQFKKNFKPKTQLIKLIDNTSALDNQAEQENQIEQNENKAEAKTSKSKQIAQINDSKKKLTNKPFKVPIKKPQITDENEENNKEYDQKKDNKKRKQNLESQEKDEKKAKKLKTKEKKPPKKEKMNEEPKNKEENQKKQEQDKKQTTNNKKLQEKLEKKQKTKNKKSKNTKQKGDFSEDEFSDLEEENFDLSGNEIENQDLKQQKQNKKNSDRNSVKARKSKVGHYVSVLFSSFAPDENQVKELKKIGISYNQQQKKIKGSPIFENYKFFIPKNEYFETVTLDDIYDIVECGEGDILEEEPKSLDDFSEDEHVLIILNPENKKDIKKFSSLGFECVNIELLFTSSLRQQVDVKEFVY
ncbi:hypothetical protein PPERSA_06287 [Pseudocohnilembus persalinus]|uniref:BRCT domain-containing protein n=1 Tax=Pseudocohnilembus persalinus TaxID=266149 RepID=A0A0V0QVC5_PSEPJ|nr:hypothetical protein PPERSA_06287 [Pseudocohnilembus persalinus]|eukprot:KRX06316.1 hypothetical protein PPERSA_06287 [Pseudocohnilembus persalinus]